MTALTEGATVTWPFADLWDRGLTWEQFLTQSTAHCELWKGVYRLARVPAWAVEAASRLEARFRLVVLAEDWCGDATNTVPILARWAEAVPNVEMRILRRDEYPAVMDRYLTGGKARSIPVVVVLTEAMEELGWWGPRPRALQSWTADERAKGRTKAELYPEIRRWYAKDKGETTIREVLAVMTGTPQLEGVPTGATS
jgi:hypothetical protein